jgi:hypothetical protein
MCVIGCTVERAQKLQRAAHARARFTFAALQVAALLKTVTRSGAGGELAKEVAADLLDICMDHWQRRSVHGEGGLTRSSSRAASPLAAICSCGKSGDGGNAHIFHCVEH